MWHAHAKDQRLLLDRQESLQALGSAVQAVRLAVANYLQQHNDLNVMLCVWHALAGMLDARLDAL